ncbi:MAG: YdjY domain-containing protein [Planctomycetota bacterium]|nr:YdjY domain-containing protein [Planctomycetota bacterium]
MRILQIVTIPVLTCLLLIACRSTENPAAAPPLPGPGQAIADLVKGEVIVHATVQHPEGKPCIDDWGQRPQAFAGCKYGAGGNAKYADFFVFLADVSVEQVHDSLLKLGAKPKVHYTIEEAKKRSGLKVGTKPEDYLQGDPVVISVFWQDGSTWKELPYEEFVEEKVLVEGGEVVKPWTPHFVFHGSGAIHSSGTGCLACPCDCPGGIIADNRYPVYDPKPILRFDWTKAPPVGTQVYVRMRPICSRAE